MHKRIFLLAAALSAVCGCGGGDTAKFSAEEMASIPLAQREGLPEPSGGFVLAVANETITSDQVVLPLVEYFRAAAQRTELEQFKIRARQPLEQIVINQTADILLYRQARAGAGGEQVDEAIEKLVDGEVRRFIISHGNDYAKAEEALKETGMDWQSFRKQQKKMILGQSHVASELPEETPITYGELLDYYDQNKEELFVRPAMVKFRLIDIDTSKIEVTDPNQSRYDQAKELAYELVRQLHEGKDFGELARQYSQGHRAAAGGLWQPIQPQSLAEPYDILATEAENIAPGQIAGPIEKGGHFFIMRLEEKQAKSCQPLEEVQEQLEARIMLQRRKAAIEEFNRKLVEQAQVGERAGFVDFCLEEIYRLSRQ
ncbi:MAG: peptidylprolyl isomerase [Planctomycetota bacterium]|jgi:parvulin-like peptidyl-prolyl isomerase